MKAVIASAVRTPFGSFQGVLSPLKASEIGAAAIKEAVRRAGVENDHVDMVYMGNVLPAGMGQAPARQATIYAGLSEHTPTVTVSKVCGSGMESIIQAARAVMVGDANVVVAGGMESMTNAPYLVPGARGGLKMGDKQLVDHMVNDGLWDVYNDKHMGMCAEMCADKYSFSREDQDEFATASYERAAKANQDGGFDDEMVSVEVTGRKGDVTVISEDEEPKKLNTDKIAKLRPAFKRDGGSVTAANASGINDGAAAVVVTTDEYANANGLPVLVTIEGYAANAIDPEWFTIAPVGAMKKLFEKTDTKPEDYGLYEVNEAFAVVSMAAMEEFGISHDQINVHGGAVALGHPIGASGTRIVVTLLHAMKQRDQERGMASICIGGGEALAMAVALA